MAGSVGHEDHSYLEATIVNLYILRYWSRIYLKLKTNPHRNSGHRTRDACMIGEAVR